MHEALSPRRSSSGPATACRRIPRAWLVSAGRFKGIDAIRRQSRTDGDYDTVARPDGRRQHGSRARGGRDRRGRPPAAHLHLLPPGARAGRAGRDDACARSAALDRGEIASAFLVPAPDARATHRARQGEDPRCADSLRSPDADRAAGAARRRPARDLSRLQRGLCGLERRVADAGRPLRGGDPARAAARRRCSRSPRPRGFSR